MWHKSTNDLKQELMDQPDISKYLACNRSLFQDQDIGEALSQMYKRVKCSKAELARRAGMSEVYLHQLFAGRRKPSRDRLLSICIAMESSLTEIQKMLKGLTYAQLYPKVRRDAIIIHGIVHHRALSEINEALFQANEKTLS